MLSDTHPDAEKVQIELIRRASIADRIAVMRSMTRMATRLSRQAIAEANPQASPEEVKLMWAELHYGPELIAKVRESLGRSKPCHLKTPSRP
jgi:hypothetical protein